MNKVDNSVGQQHAYLKEWNGRSHNDIKFKLIPNLEGPFGGKHIHGDCFKVDYPIADLVIFRSTIYPNSSISRILSYLGFYY